jgi:hypothetical protein
VPREGPHLPMSDPPFPETLPLGSIYARATSRLNGPPVG